MQLTDKEIASVCQRAEAFLKDNGIASQEITRLRITIEEALLRYQEQLGSDFQFTVDVGKRLGQAKIRVIVPGTMLNPFEHAHDPDDVDSAMLRAVADMGQLPAWRYERGRNILTFSPLKKSLPEWAKLLAAIAAAGVCGLLIRLAPDATRALLQQDVIAPLMSTFLGFLNAIAGPMIFLSVVWGIYSIGDASTFSVLGKKLIARYGLCLTAMLLAVAALSWPLFHLNMASGPADSGSFGVLYQMILDIVPTNLFKPFSEGNTLQILFIAVVVGITMILLGEKSELIASLAQQLSFIVNSIMGFVGKLVPFFVFGSLFNIIAGSDLSVLAGSGKFFFGTIAGCGLILLFHTGFSAIHDRISPIDLWKRSLSTFLIGLTTASSSAAFADNLNTCKEKHRIDPKLVNFGVPFGQILYKPATAIMYWFAAMSVAERSGIAVSVPWVVTALVVSIVLSAATPPIPGGAAASFSILFSQLGLPTESLAILLALNVIQDYFRTATNLFSGQCVLLDASKKLKMSR